jgi:hypothetical protein
VSAHVYILPRDDGLFKIGHSVNIQARIRDQRFRFGCEAELVCSVPGPRKHEAELHRLLRQ